MDLNGKSILVTGGTGSFGHAFIKRVLDSYPDVQRLIVYSRDELKQFEMQQKLSVKDHPPLRYFIGDVRDGERFKQACEGVDIIIHAAALKQVPAAEYNPIECIKTNVLGAENVIQAALANNVEKVVALSTDKAAAPINLYGATKLCSDKLFTAANNMRGPRETSFSVVRYGNVMGSRGSVIPFFLSKRSSGVLPITHESMTRFNITLDAGVDLVFSALDRSWGGEVFVPKIPSYRITEMAEAIGPECQHPIVGIRPGEKLHEEMITETDSYSTLDCGEYFVILPTSPIWDVGDYIERFGASRVPEGFKYRSDLNEDWLDKSEIRRLIIDHVDEEFTA